MVCDSLGLLGPGLDLGWGASFLMSERGCLQNKNLVLIFSTKFIIIIIIIFIVIVYVCYLLDSQPNSARHKEIVFQQHQ